MKARIDYTNVPEALRGMKISSVRCAENDLRLTVNVENGIKTIGAGLLPGECAAGFA
jgi:hypothetical protein